MRFDRDDARRIAALARLSLTDAELDRFAGQLASVLDHVAALGDGAADAVPAGSAAPSSTRADREAFDLPARPPVSFAPEFTDGFFVVPRLPAFDGEGDPPPGEG
ncbi:MAG: Asp-tRNA(Asn)/Glu-tRNA(Gln) amidotransferase GatCAB subunit C [Gemmatimonadota bacterium]